MTETRPEFPIIEKLGGEDAVLRKLTELTPLNFYTPRVLRMWRLRQRVPGHAIVWLMWLAERENLPVASSDFRYPAPEAAE